VKERERERAKKNDEVELKLLEIYSDKTNDYFIYDG
jgi:hypothetical protein